MEPEVIADRNADPLGWLGQREEAAARFGYTMTGFKLFPFHERRVIDHVLEDKRYKLILLSRENRLAQYSSGRIAVSTGQWVLKEGQTKIGKDLLFDPQDFEGYEAWLDGVDRMFHEGFERHGRSVLSVDYVSLQKAATLERLSRWLGRAVTYERRSTTRRQNPRRIAERFANRNELMEYLALRGLTRWAEDG